MRRASGSASSAGWGRQKKRQTSSLPGAPKASATWGAPPSGRKFVNAPSASSAARASVRPRRGAGGGGEHPAARRGDDDRRRRVGDALEPEAAGPALAGEDRAQGLDRLAHLGERLGERDAASALDADVR